MIGENGTHSGSGNQIKYVEDGWLYKINTKDGDEALSETYVHQFPKYISNLESAVYEHVGDKVCRTKLLNNEIKGEAHMSLEDFIYL